MCNIKSVKKIIPIFVLVIILLSACDLFGDKSNDSHIHNWELQTDGTLKCPSCKETITKSYYGELYGKTVSNLVLFTDGNYSNSTGKAKNIVIYTKGETLTINAPTDSVIHYGEASNVNVIAVANNSYHGYAEISDKLSVQSGNVELNANVKDVVIEAKTKVSFKIADDKTVNSLEVKYALGETNADVSIEVAGKVNNINLGIPLKISIDATSIIGEIVVNVDNVVIIAENTDSVAKITENGHTVSTLNSDGEHICFHDWVDCNVSKQPTCTESGTKTVRCLKCSKIEDREISALGHNLQETIISATKQSQGYTLHKCINCGYSFKDSFTPILSPSDLTQEEILIVEGTLEDGLHQGLYDLSSLTYWIPLIPSSFEAADGYQSCIYTVDWHKSASFLAVRRHSETGKYYALIFNETNKQNPLQFNLNADVDFSEESQILSYQMSGEILSVVLMERHITTDNNTTTIGWMYKTYFYIVNDNFIKFLCMIDGYVGSLPSYNNEENYIYTYNMLYSELYKIYLDTGSVEICKINSEIECSASVMQLPDGTWCISFSYTLPNYYCLINDDLANYNWGSEINVSFPVSFYGVTRGFVSFDKSLDCYVNTDNSDSNNRIRDFYVKDGTTYLKKTFYKDDETIYSSNIGVIGGITSLAPSGDGYYIENNCYKYVFWDGFTTANRHELKCNIPKKNMDNTIAPSYNSDRTNFAFWEPDYGSKYYNFYYDAETDNLIEIPQTNIYVGIRIIEKL